MSELCDPIVPGACLHSRDISSEHKRGAWLREPGVPILTSQKHLIFRETIHGLVYVKLTVLSLHSCLSPWVSSWHMC
jgi:hypothetical protein